MAVEPYLRAQGRFKDMSETQVSEFRNEVNERFARLQGGISA
ncbi:MAG: hypothetical protein ACLFUE_11035 [Desulfobacteraceae bacterium]